MKGVMNITKHNKRNVCGAKRTNKTGTCKLPAGYGTNHLGTGRCKWHGGCSTGPKVANTPRNPETNGLFTKYLPEETMEIVNGIQDLNTETILWDNIKIQYAAILRAQRIMEVKSQKDLVKELKSFKELPNGMTQEEYEIQFAWDRQERFLNSQARAMTNLTNMIGKYEEILNRDIKNEEQILKVEKLKTEIDTLKGINREIEDLSEIQEAIYGKKEDD